MLLLGEQIHDTDETVLTGMHQNVFLGACFPPVTIVTETKKIMSQSKPAAQIYQSIQCHARETPAHVKNDLIVLHGFTPDGFFDDAKKQSVA